MCVCVCDVYFTVTCGSLRVFTVTFLAVVVKSLYFHSMQVVNKQTFDRPAIQCSVQYHTCSGYSTIYSPYYCILIILFYVIAKFVYLVTIYFFSDTTCFEVCVLHF